MRLWSIHPRYLDVKGLVALWREALLARAVLKGETKGYTHHPQLNRFRDSLSPILSIDYYLYTVFLEAQCRGYRFDGSKLVDVCVPSTIEVYNGQIMYEFDLLKAKLKGRSPLDYTLLLTVDHIEPNPLFKIVQVDRIALWEKVK